MIDQLLISPRCVTKDIYHFPNSSPWGEIIRCTLESNFHVERVVVEGWGKGRAGVFLRCHLHLNEPVANREPQEAAAFAAL